MIFYYHKDFKSHAVRVILLVMFLLVSTLGNAQHHSGKVMIGKASYYAKAFHGRKMSNGQIYRNEAMTCAHKYLPFGTHLKVRNPKNGKEVVVTVTDRGPFVSGRIIDLSYAAAKEIGMLHAGVLTVEVSILSEAKFREFEREKELEKEPEIKRIPLDTVPAVNPLNKELFPKLKLNLQTSLKGLETI